MSKPREQVNRCTLSARAARRGLTCPGVDVQAFSIRPDFPGDATFEPMAEYRYVVDVDDPRAPSEEEWSAMSESQRERVVAALPSEYPRATPPEGDFHFIPKARALDTLSEHYRRTRRRVYLSAELPIYYPAQPIFAPDLIAVRDVEPVERMRWVVTKEGKGIDFALEIHVAGSARKDFTDNVVRFASLGIPEYFALDVTQARLVGWRLPASGARKYEPILPQGGRWSSSVLELDLSLEDGNLRFLHGSAPLLDSRELIAQLSRMVDGAVRRAEEQTQRAEEQTQRAEEQTQRAERFADKLRALGVDPNTFE